MLAGDLLGANMLFDGQREVSTAFHRGIVSDNHTFDAGNTANAGDHASGGNFAIVNVVRCQGGKL